MVDQCASVVCLLVTFASPAKTVEPIEMPIDRVKIPHGRGHWPIEKHWESLRFTQQETNYCDSGTAATGCNAPHWSVSQYIVPDRKYCPCDAAFRQNSLTIFTLTVSYGKPSVTVWRPSVLLSVCRSLQPLTFLVYEN